MFEIMPNTYFPNNLVKTVTDSVGGHIVSEWDENNLSKSEKNSISKFTKDWEATKKNDDKEAMTKALERAEKIRDKSRDDDEEGMGDGNTHKKSRSMKHSHSSDRDSSRQTSVIEVTKDFISTPIQKVINIIREDYSKLVVRDE